MNALDDTFPKKRRNLLVATSVLLFMKYAEAEVISSSSISMLKFEIGKPEAILQAIWVVWAYCLIRAYQHFSFYLRREYYRSCQRTIAPIIHPYVSGAGVPPERDMFFFEDLERFHNYDVTFRPQFIIEDLRATFDFLARKVRSSFQGPARGRRINLLRYPAGYFRDRFARYGAGDAWRIEVWTITDRSVVGGGKMPVEIAACVGLNFLSGLALRVKIWFSLIFKSAPFFEVRLPFIYALTPLVYYSAGR